MRAQPDAWYSSRIEALGQAANHPEILRSRLVFPMRLLDRHPTLARCGTGEPLYGTTYRLAGFSIDHVAVGVAHHVSQFGWRNWCRGWSQGFWGMRPGKKVSRNEQEKDSQNDNSSQATPRGLRRKMDSKGCPSRHESLTASW